MDDKLGHWLVGVFVAGPAVIVVVTAYQILSPCPDFTDSQSRYSANATWTLFPTRLTLPDGCQPQIRSPGNPHRLAVLLQGLRTDLLAAGWAPSFRFVATCDEPDRLGQKPQLPKPLASSPRVK